MKIPFALQAKNAYIILAPRASRVRTRTSPTARKTLKTVASQDSE